MRAKRRVVTVRPANAAGTRRTPTVRRLKPALGGPSVAPARAVRPVVAAATPDHEPQVQVDLSVDLGRGLVLDNPIVVASGTFGYGVEYGEAVDVGRLGAICSRGTTLKPRIGNGMPRVSETPGGLLNAIGLQNPGVDAVVDRYAGTWAGWRVPVIVNLGAESVRDYVELARRLDGLPGVAGIELNLSCPNVGRGGLQFAIDAESAASVTAAVRRATDLPLLVKLSPNVTDVRSIAHAIEAAGADVVTAVNTLSGMAVTPSRERPLLGNVYGGVSGPALKPIALRVVYEIAQVVDIPVVAIGGVTELADVLDFLAVGAVAVAVGTAIFADPTLPIRLIDELAGECTARRLESYTPLVGTALPRRTTPPSVKGVEYRP